MELVRRVTGHSTVNIVLDHYFRPGREDFRQVCAEALHPPHLSVAATEGPNSITSCQSIPHG